MTTSRQQLEREVEGLGLSLRAIDQPPPADARILAIDEATAASLQAPLGMALAVNELVPAGPDCALAYLKSTAGDRLAVGVVRGDTISRAWDVPDTDRGVFDLAWIDGDHFAATTRRRAVVIHLTAGGGTEVGSGSGGGHGIAAFGSLIIQSTGSPGGDSQPRLWRWDGSKLRRLGVIATPGVCVRTASGARAVIEHGVYTGRGLEIACYELVDSTSPGGAES